MQLYLEVVAMLLKQNKDTGGHLVELTEIGDLINPNHTHIEGRLDYGEELQDPEQYAKADLIFPSGEPLPSCWIDPHYRDNDLRK